MNLIRPIRKDDLDPLYQMALDSGVGVTTLPANKQQMEHKLDRAVKAFAQTVEQRDSLYLFALEDIEQGKVAGICAIESQIGNEEVWYNYRLGNTVHASKELGVHKQTPTLYLSNDLTGATELCTLFLAPDYRKGLNGRLLSKSRYMFLAEFAERFTQRVIAEMRGYSDDDGRSPFWESLGRLFFSMQFKDADYLTGLGNKAFIAELMPKYPIYVPFLTEEAQEVIGAVHENTKPALAMLEAEGFRKNGYVDIFDAGPTVECRLDDIRAVRESRLLTVAIDDAAKEIEDPKGPVYLVSNRQFEEYRVGLTPGTNVNEETVVMTAKTAEHMFLKAGDSVRVVSLRPGQN